jgi:DNA repair exonuclease SbcCD ATPase subunit
MINEARIQQLENEITALKRTLQQSVDTIKSLVDQQCTGLSVSLKEVLSEINTTISKITADVDEIESILNGDENLTSGLRQDVQRLQQTSADFEQIVHQLQGDGSPANPGALNELAKLLKSYQDQQVVQRTVLAIVISFGIGLLGFFWSHLTGGIKDNAVAIEAVRSQEHKISEQLSSISTDLQWLKNKK